MFKNVSLSFGIKNPNPKFLNIQNSQKNINSQHELEVSLVKSEQNFRSLLTLENLSNYKRDLKHLKKCNQIGKFNKRIYRNAIFDLQMKYAKTTRNFEIAIEIIYCHLDICEMLDNLY